MPVVYGTAMLEKRYGSLRAENFYTAKKMKVTVLEEPYMVVTKFRQDQLTCKVETPHGDICKWFLNTRTANFLIDLWGPEEQKWVGKTILLTYIKQPVDGTVRSVIYPDALLKEITIETAETE